MNPRNPHAHTNLIKSADGDYTIIDLESAEISLLPAPGQFRSSLKSGNLPIFDDIDFPRLRDFIVTNEAALTSSIGADGVKALIHATDHAEEAINTWKAAEPRVIGHLIAGTYRLLNVKARFQHLMGSLAGADAAAELFLNSGIDRWEKESRIAPEEADELRTRLASEPAREETKHLGVHLVMSVAIALPVPGMRSLARFLWTLVFWSKAQIVRFGRKPEGGAGRLPNVHTPVGHGVGPDSPDWRRSLPGVRADAQQDHGAPDVGPSRLETAVPSIPQDPHRPLAGTAGPEFRPTTLHKTGDQKQRPPFVKGDYRGISAPRLSPVRPTTQLSRRRSPL